eukprot:NODE_27_length_39007_cov_1.590650.p23 type:complete len:177 gc:universal NODE_27_length_39007_cov_1.590650:18743-19273(+)
MSKAMFFRPFLLAILRMVLWTRSPNFTDTGTLTVFVIFFSVFKIILASIHLSTDCENVSLFEGCSTPIVIRFDGPILLDIGLSKLDIGLGFIVASMLALSSADDMGRCGNGRLYFASFFDVLLSSNSIDLCELAPSVISCKKTLISSCKVETSTWSLLLEKRLRLLSIFTLRSFKT